MKEKPIIFTAESVNAIRDGRKTQTRRVIQPQPEFIFDDWYWWGGSALKKAGYGAEYVHSDWDSIERAMFKVAPYQVGDRLWVREAFYCDDLDYPNGMLEEMLRCLYYRADGDCCSQIPECQCAYFGGVRWKSPLFMPRWASRITLEVTAVRVERLQDISEKDALAEGIGYAMTRDCKVPQFAMKWDEINGKRAPWQSNSWVWVVEFQRVGL